MLDITANKKLVFRRAKMNEIDEIHNILLNSFEPYRKYFTEEGFSSAVLSIEEIKKRIKNYIFKVYVVIIDKKIVGTASILPQDDRYYLRSMAVDPNYQNKGIGLFILENISNVAEKENIRKISLESFKPLYKAIGFYEKYGFKKTGITKDLCGNEIFEMIKQLD